MGQDEKRQQLSGEIGQTENSLGVSSQAPLEWMSLQISFPRCSVPAHEKLNYVEFPAKDLVATKTFFSQAFGWEFTDYGPEYTSFSNEGLDGGFFQANQACTTAQGGALLVFYSSNLEQTQDKVKANGGKVVQAIFSFPGGRRFHFTEPSGNEFAVWSDRS